MTFNTREATDVDIHVGRRLKVLRRQRNMSQATVAKGMDLTSLQIQRYERAKKLISVGRLWQFCEFFNVMPNYFYTGLTIVSVGAVDSKRKSDFLEYQDFGDDLVYGDKQFITDTLARMDKEI